MYLSLELEREREAERESHRERERENANMWGTKGMVMGLYRKYRTLFTGPFFSGHRLSFSGQLFFLIKIFFYHSEV